MSVHATGFWSRNYLMIPHKQIIWNLYTRSRATRGRPIL